VLGFELRTLCLPSRCSTTWAPLPAFLTLFIYNNGAFHLLLFSCNGLPDQVNWLWSNIFWISLLSYSVARLASLWPSISCGL
jgi:hypothetical protein